LVTNYFDAAPDAIKRDLTRIESINWTTISRGA